MKNKKPKVALLIDADIIIFKAASIAEKPVNWGNGFWTLHAFEEPAKKHIDSYVTGLKEKLKADIVYMCLSDSKSNFRKEVLPDYKANRKTTRQPLIRQALREYVESKYICKVVDSLEADDVLGVMATSSQKSEKRIMVSQDKDLEQIPSLLYNPDKDTVPRLIDEKAAIRWFFIQALTGDKTDNYDGCPKIGIKTAEKILTPKEGEIETPEWLWGKVLAQYEKAGLNEEYALTQVRCAKILTNKDYNFKNKKVKLWSPKS
jgi:5'-3' exonuclease